MEPLPPPVPDDPSLPDEPPTRDPLDAILRRCRFVSVMLIAYLTAAMIGYGIGSQRIFGFDSGFENLVQLVEERLAEQEIVKTSEAGKARQHTENKNSQVAQQRAALRDVLLRTERRMEGKSNESPGELAKQLLQAIVVQPDSENVEYAREQLAILKRLRDEDAATNLFSAAEEAIKEERLDAAIDLLAEYCRHPNANRISEADELAYEIELVNARHTLVEVIRTFDETALRELIDSERLPDNTGPNHIGLREVFRQKLVALAPEERKRRQASDQILLALLKDRTPGQARSAFARYWSGDTYVPPQQYRRILVWEVREQVGERIRGLVHSMYGFDRHTVTFEGMTRGKAVVFIVDHGHIGSETGWIPAPIVYQGEMGEHGLGGSFSSLHNPEKSRGFGLFVLRPADEKALERKLPNDNEMGYFITRYVDYKRTHATLEEHVAAVIDLYGMFRQMAENIEADGQIDDAGGGTLSVESSSSSNPSRRGEAATFQITGKIVSARTRRGIDNAPIVLSVTKSDSITSHTDSYKAWTRNGGNFSIEVRVSAGESVASAALWLKGFKSPNGQTWFGDPSPFWRGRLSGNLNLTFEVKDM